MEDFMNATTIRPRRAILGFALGLGLAAIIGVTGLVRADGTTNFVCHAKSGGWCDLRDWNGFDKAF